MGLWMDVTTVGDGQIDIALGANFTFPTSTGFSLKSGWNLIGFPSDDTTYTVGNLKTDCIVIDIVEGFAPGEVYRTAVLANSQTMQSGRGYWVHCTADSAWTKTW